MKWIVGSANHGCWLGTYELAKQHALEHFVRSGMVAYDVGAQAGFYSLLFSRLVGPTGTVYGFEPCAYEARYLLDHVRMNHLRNVRVIQAAVWAASSLVTFTVDRGQTENAILGDGGADSFLQIPAIALDGLNIPPPNLIKMDVEGAESAVLEGARKTLQLHRPIVFVALHGAEQRHACVRMLKQSDYKLYQLDGRPLAEDAATDEIYALPQS